MAMHLRRDGGSDLKVEHVVDISRAAGHAIMEVYRSDSEVRAVQHKISISVVRFVRKCGAIAFCSLDIFAREGHSNHHSSWLR